ncbi:DUF2514 family protein [Pseudomonas sp. TWI628]|uniref:DUF2514 family protein n=1 Tax=Pseudomonas sp. TWI628 TaxID=3136788 RepID=UPI0032084858
MASDREALALAKGRRKGNIGLRTCGSTGAPSDSGKPRRALQENARNDQREQRVVADAGHAGRRLHDDAARLAERPGACSANPAVAARGQASTRATMMLSDLLTRTDARAGELAKLMTEP